MSDASHAPLHVALVLPEVWALPGAARGAAHLARWIADDPRMVLVDIARVPVPRAKDAAARVVRFEAGLRPGPAPDPLPTPQRLPEGGTAEVVVDLTGRAAAAAAAEATPTFGTWRLSAFAPGAGLAAVAGRVAASHVTLISRSATGDALLAEARYSPKPTAGLNANFIAEKSVQLVERALSGLHGTRALPVPPEALGTEEGATGPLAPASSPLPAPPPSEQAPVAATGRYLAGLGPMLLRRVGQRVAARAGWQPGLFAMRLCAGGPLDFDPAQGVTLMPPKGAFWADPFLLSHAGEDFLFYEEFLEATQLGVLKVARLHGDRMEELGHTVTRPHHLSFPFVFEAEGEIWMIPEASRGGGIEVWRATGFPLTWSLEATAMEGLAPADSVLVQVDGTWWLFTHISRDSFRDYCSELHVFRVDGPCLRRIEPHPLNPVVIDSRTARAGGRIWAAGGRLLRASQDNSHGLYGWGLNVMEITRLDMGGYAERPVRHIAPGFAPGVIGCHHMDFAGHRVVIDVRYRFPGVARGG